MKRAAFYTLGCKLNFAETSTLARALAAAGVERAGRGEAADIYLINTCSVTGQADKKCRNLIRRLASQHPEAIVAVTGCYAQLRPAEVAAIPGVDLVVGNGDKGSLAERVAALAAKGKTAVQGCDHDDLTSFFAAFSSNDRTRAYLKVQDGCDYRCAYCTIPAARGSSRNTPIAEAVEAARRIAGQGQREIVITGVNTGDFGRTTGERFVDLLAALEAVEGIERYRVSSIEPNLLTDEVIALTAASAKFQPHFHIPLQSGSDRVLALMRRRYTTEIFAGRVAAVQEAMLEAFIGIDTIVGFPGETAADFEETVRFLERVAPAFIHVFPYSARPGTPAAAMPGHVPPPVIAERVGRLAELSARLHRAFAGRFVGARLPVLFESTQKGGLMFGYTPNYLRVEAPCLREAIGAILPVRLADLTEEGHLRGVIDPVK